jgi:hypothetical protein
MTTKKTATSKKTTTTRKNGNTTTPSALRSLNVTEHTEKKGKFSYLSWAWAVDTLIEHHPDASWEVKRFPMVVAEKHPVLLSKMIELSDTDDSGNRVIEDQGVHEVTNTTAIPQMLVPYMRTEAGYFVEVAVTVNNITRSQIHPVLDHRNQPLAKPSSFDINTAIQRCLAKAIALHGLGLYIYAGEDLPPDDPHRFEPGEKEKIITEMREHLKNGDEHGVMEIYNEYTQDDPEESIKFWTLFSSTERAAIKVFTGEQA